MILFQIIEQHQDITSIGGNDIKNLCDDDESYIGSSHYPAFYDTHSGSPKKLVLYVRGFEKDKDFELLKKTFNNNEERDMFYDLLLEKLKAITQ